MSFTIKKAVLKVREPVGQILWFICVCKHITIEMVVLQAFAVIFFANYVNIFQKNEILTIILKCLTCLDHHWINCCKTLFFCFRLLTIL